MYEQYWKLSCRPFENRFDGNFYYPSESQQAAAIKLRYAVENRRSVVLLTGISGMGKTMLLKQLRDQMAEWIQPFGSLAFPLLDAQQFLRVVAKQLQPSVDPVLVRETDGALEVIEQTLRFNTESGRHAVLAVDEAHALEQQGLLEPIRFLLNLAADTSHGESSLTVVLVGQPTLLAQVQRYSSLDERVAIRASLPRFGMDETIAYIIHRIRVAGGNAEEIFDDGALEQVYMLTQGIPRRINRLCDLALMVGFAEDTHNLTVELLENVHGDLATPSLVD